MPFALNSVPVLATDELVATPSGTMLSIERCLVIFSESSVLAETELVLTLSLDGKPTAVETASPLVTGCFVFKSVVDSSLETVVVFSSDVIEFLRVVCGEVSGVDFKDVESFDEVFL